MGRGKPFAGAQQHRGPEYGRDARRRRAFVTRWLRANGVKHGDGAWEAECQMCHRVLCLAESNWTADHIVPVALGGDEHGELQVACRSCQQSQASAIATARNPMAQSRKRQPEPHPGTIRRRDDG